MKLKTGWKSFSGLNCSAMIFRFRPIESGRMFRHLLFQAPAFGAVVLFSGCGGSGQWHRDSGAVWNTTYTITYEASAELGDSIQEIFRMVDGSLSPFNPASLVSRVNRNEDVMADSLLQEVLDVSSDVYCRSGGKFDPTVSPVVNLWKFGYTGKVDPGDSWEPSAEEIDSVMKYVGLDGCRIAPDGRLVKKHPSTAFNFSAVAKGYACDLVASMLRRNGAENLMVEIGGEVVVAGKNPRGGAWRLQVDTPVVSGGEPVHDALEILEVTDCGVATSGNYRNYHDSPRGRVGHTIDPLTGYPVVTPVLSVTVIAPTCAEADAWATAAMASPSVEFADSILRGAGLRALIVTAADTAGYNVLKVGL